MARLLIHVEGETEESFVNEVLGPNLYCHGYSVVSARRSETHSVVPRKSMIRRLRSHPNGCKTSFRDIRSR